MILVDEERVELFASMQSDLGEMEMYCWSDTASSKHSFIKVCVSSRFTLTRQSNVEEIASVTSKDMELVKDGSNLAQLNPESDAVIFFTSG